MGSTGCQGSLIGVAIAEPWARTFAAESVSGESAHTIFLNRRDLEAARDSEYSGLVYDLHPWDAEVAGRFGRLCSRRPDLPVLLYVPPTPRALGSLNEIETRHGLRFQVQVREGLGLNSLRQDVRWLLSAIPRSRVMALLTEACPQLGAVSYLFAHHVLGVLALGRRPTAVATARALGISLRTLERRLEADHLLSPKRFIAWLTVFQIADMTDRSGMSFAWAARVVNLTSNDIYRLRRRLIGNSTSRPRGDLLSPYLLAFSSAVRLRRREAPPSPERPRDIPSGRDALIANPAPASELGPVDQGGFH